MDKVIDQPRMVEPELLDQVNTSSTCGQVLRAWLRNSPNRNGPGGVTA